MTFDQVSILISQMGPILDPIAIDEIREEKTWGIALKEDLAVLVQFDEQRNCLVLASELGAPPAGDRTALYEILLQTNFHWDTTGGTRMALNGPGGEVVQVFEIATDGLDASQLSAIVSSFADGARAWREFVQLAGSVPVPTPPEPTFLHNRV